MIDPSAEVDVAARGLNASPGAASGAIVLDADTAEERGKAGEDVILVRWETTPDDIHGVIEARGSDSEVAVNGPFGGVWEFRDGMAVRICFLSGRGEALEAAGLRE